MLSIKSLGLAGAPGKNGVSGSLAAYFENLSIEGYYQDGGEPPGQWDGKLASAFGLSGNVRPGQLQKLFEGCHPISGDALAKNAGPEHKAGYDFTFSAPKAVSVAWALADSEIQKQIADAHDQAVKAALEYLERNAFSSRDRNGESPLQGIIAATFQHSTSRELDPQLHTHCVIANLGLRQDGTVCALDCDTRYKIAAGAYYRTALIDALQNQGFEIERDGKSFKLSAIPDDLCKQFSKRRQQIESYLDEHGFHDSAKAANIAALATRRAKESPNRGILREQWQREAEQAGYSQESIKQMLTPGQPKERDRPKLDIPTIISGLTQNESFFTRQQFEAAIAIECQGVCGAAEIPIIIERAIRDGLSNQEQDGLVKLDGPADQPKSRRKTEIYTTREMLQLEREALDFAVRGKDDRRHVVPVDPKLVEGLSDEQANAVRQVTERSGQVVCIVGLAGTGKSYSMKTAKIAWEIEGFEVVGAALAGKAADGLEQSSGIKSQTLHSLLAELDSGSRVLTEKSVVVLDECGMLGTRLLVRIMQHAEKSGSRLVLCGDPQQLQSIEAGGLFKGISDRIGYAELTDIRRQKNVEDRATIKKLLAGDAEEVIERLADAGQLRIERDDQVAEKMVLDWLETRDPSKPGQALMLAGTRAEVRTLNMIARAKLLGTGQLHSEVTIPTEHGEKSFFVGERVCFGRNNRALGVGVKNGQLGTLESWTLHPRTGAIELSVRMDSGDVVSFDPARYGHIDSGFAMSIHKSQGVTADRVSVMLTEQMTDQELSYVAVSRHRERLRVFVPKSMSDDLSRNISRSRQKVLASEQTIRKKLEMSLEC